MRGGFRLAIRRKQAPRHILVSPRASELFLAPRLANYVLVEKGRFDGERWVARQRRNGDESDYGVCAAADVGGV